MAGSDLGFSIEGWDEFVERFAELVDMWGEKKKILLQYVITVELKKLCVSVYWVAQVVVMLQ